LQFFRETERHPKKKKNTDAPPPEFNWRLQLLVPPPQKKIAKNQNSTGKSPNCNYIKAPKSAADGKKLKVFRHD
jgi:hypothetical protein